MTVTTGEMTLTEMYRDPLILSVMRADGIALNEFKEMMAAATASLKTRGATLPEVRFRTTEAAASSRSPQVATMQPLFAGSFQSCCAIL